MTLLQNFQGQTAGIEVTEPAASRFCNGVLGLHWQARGGRGAGGTYWSDVPRLMLFLDDMSSVKISEGGADPRRAGRPVSDIVYVPAGYTLRSHFTAALEFRHLDLHFDPIWLRDYLGPALGETLAEGLMNRMIERDAPPQVHRLAELLIDEISGNDFDDLYFENLTRAVLMAALAPEIAAPQRCSGRLTSYQMQKLKTAFAKRGGRRMPVSDMAAVVGLSESWFSHAFKSTTGMSPLQWQKEQRVRSAQELLRETGLSVAEIAGRLGFADQSHFTKVFRAVAGQTPANWRRSLTG